MTIPEHIREEAEAALFGIQLFNPSERQSVVSQLATAILAAEQRGMERAAGIAEVQWLEEGERAKKVKGEMRYLTLGKGEAESSNLSSSTSALGFLPIFRTPKVHARAVIHIAMWHKTGTACSVDVHGLSVTRNLPLNSDFLPDFIHFVRKPAYAVRECASLIREAV